MGDFGQCVSQIQLLTYDLITPALSRNAETET
jgi:hypothetical protein